jgi:quercetin 2,3-dioxygenase
METSFTLDIEESRIEKPYNILGMPTYLKIAAKDTNGHMSMFYGDYRRNQGPPLHQNGDLEETFYVTEGEFIFQLGDKKVKAVAGTTIFIPRMMPHTFLVTSEVGRTLFILSPSGKIEELFAKYDSFVTIPPVEELMRVSEELGFPVIGPPITED